jgi:hypothetical protein
MSQPVPEDGPLLHPGDPVSARSRRSISTKVLALSDEEMRVVERVARRIHGELRELLGALPGEVRNASRLSRQL